MYVYKSTIVTTLASVASIVYSKGFTAGSTIPNSTVVIDSSSTEQKSGLASNNVWPAISNGVGAVAISRNTAMGGLIAPAGIYNTATTVSSFYGEFLNTGAGSYAKNVAARASYGVSLTADQASQFTIEKAFRNAVVPYGSSSLSWIDKETRMFYYLCRIQSLLGWYVAYKLRMILDRH